MSMSADQACNDLHLDGNLSIGSNTFTLNGNIYYGSGKLTANGRSGLTINGSGSINTLQFDQTTNGVTNTYVNFTFNRSSQTITLGNTLKVTGTITPTAGTLASAGYLNLVSTSSGTARIAALSTSSDITGSVNVQQYIPSVARQWRFLSSPINGNTLEDWRGELFITGSGTGGGLGSTNSNGFDYSQSKQPSVYYYDETATGGGANDLSHRWQTPSNTSYTLVSGKGYRVFVRGDRSSTGRLDGSITSQNAVTLISTGTINKGVSAVSLPVTYSGSTANDGWNLVGNPFPSQIDWNAASGWTKTNIRSTIYLWNPSTGSYGNWDGTTATNGATQYISSHQGFFVKATAASPALTCTESVKTTTTGCNMYKKPATVTNQLRIRLVRDSLNSDETVIRFMEGKKDSFDEAEDVVKLKNPAVNISSVFTDRYASVNYLSAEYDEKTVALSAWGNQQGIYRLEFTEMESFNNKASIRLVDKFLALQQDIVAQPRYNFSVTQDSNSMGENRFALYFEEFETGIKEPGTVTSPGNIVVYPVPTTSELYLAGNIDVSGVYTVEILNSLGKMSDSGKVTGTQLNNVYAWNVDHLPQGMYIIQFREGNTLIKVVRFTK
jgi:hypothetical protein